MTILFRYTNSNNLRIRKSILIWQIILCIMLMQFINKTVKYNSSAKHKI